MFDWDDYREVIRERLVILGGRGQAKRLAEAIGVSTVLLSQIINGDREISVEHAERAAAHLQLTEIEKRAFLLLVMRDRAGTESLKNFFSRDIRELQKKYSQVSERVERDSEMSGEVRAEFYSSWVYSAIRLLTSIKTIRTPEAISRRLGLPLSQVKSVLDFLTAEGLCVLENGKYSIGPQRTHLEASSPLVVNRQVHWRLQGFYVMPRRNPDDLFYTAPIAVSKADATKFREELVKLIQKVVKQAGPSEAEELFCLNIDLFTV